MKAILILFTMTLAILVLAYTQISVETLTLDTSQMVNPILGDISYEHKYGRKPDLSTDNELRVRTHLEYVENMLRQKDVSRLSAELQTKRTHLLDLLHDYYIKGDFPKNYDYLGQRKPCFIDKEGIICAVGYLIEQTTSRGVAERINSQYKYEEVLAMNDPLLDSWVQGSGLTKEECAMIQPSYGPTPVFTYNHITPAYGIASSLISGLNVSLNTINGIQIGKEASSKAVPTLGFITGLGQLTLGTAMYAKKESRWMAATYTNESEKTLSMVNMGLGTATMILSAWNLATNSKAKDKLTTWNLHSFPTRNNKTGVAFSVTRKF